jgi:DnaJ like chaperone protein
MAELRCSQFGVAMQWSGKAIGGLIGAIAGPVGSLLGILVGHQWDRNAERAGGRRSVREISQLFFEVTFEVMGQVAKVDGRVSEDEVRVARRIMQGMRLNDAQVRSAIEHFTRGKSADYPFDARLGALAAQIGGRSELARAFLGIQLQSALGAGAAGADKREMLGRVADRLDITRAELGQLEAWIRSFSGGGGGAPRATPAESLAAAYRTLGVEPKATNDEVKIAYRRLMNQHHPDKLVARGLPKSMIGVAEQKTHEVRAAYEQIKTQRGFK